MSFFFMVNSTFLYGGTPCKMHETWFLRKLIDICVVLAFWLLWILFLWMLMHKFLGRPAFLLLSMHLEMQLLGHTVILCLTLQATAKLFGKLLSPLTISLVSSYHPLHLLTPTSFSVCRHSQYTMGYHNFDSQSPSDFGAEYPFMCYWQSLHLLSSLLLLY